MSRDQPAVNGVSQVSSHDVDLTPTEEQAPTPEPAPPVSSSESDSEDIILATQHIKVTNDHWWSAGLQQVVANHSR